MSVFYVARWSVSDADLDRHGQALGALGDHTRLEHPLIEEVRLFRERWGPGARHEFIWMERYPNLAILESDCEPPACTCSDVWAPIYACAQVGTFRGAIWNDASPEAWFTRTGTVSGNQATDRK